MFFQVYKNFWQVLNTIHTNFLYFTWDRARYFSSDKAFLDHPFVQEGLKRKWMFSPKLTSLNVRKDLLVIEYPHPLCFSAGGQWRFSNKSHAGVFMSAGLYDLDPKAYEFLFLHEVSHVLKNDVFCKALVSVLGAFFWASLSFLFPSSTYMFSSAILQFLFLSIFVLPLSFTYVGALWMRLRESSSDRFAMKHSDIENLEGAVRYFSSFKAYNAELSSKFPNVFTSDGELVQGLHYPKMSKRIQNIQNEILRRKGAFYEPSREQIDAHIALLKHNDAIQAQVISSL